MAVKIDEPSIDGFSDRQIAWIFKELKTSIRKAYGFEQRREAIDAFIRESNENYERVKNLAIQSESFLLPDEELSWVDCSNIRFKRWAVHSLPQTGTSPASPGFSKPDHGVTTEADFFMFFIGTLDNWSATLAEKRLRLNIVKSMWSELLQKDRELKWLDKNNADLIEWAWIYLKENLQPTHAWHRYSPIGVDEIHTDILSIFDTWEDHPLELSDLQRKMRQAWAQQKYRTNLEKKKKKQSTYVLGNETKKNLKELAEENNVNINQMLEYIINDAYKNRKKGKPKKYTDEGNLNNGDQKLTQD